VIGKKLGPYEVLDKLGEGGMGEVFRARDTRLRRDVALKVLPLSALGDDDRRNRFEREAQVLASLNHPNIAQVFGVEDAAGTPVIVMELVDGDTLADRLAGGALPTREALVAAVQLCDGLEAAHDRGVVHRDLKPANIRLRPDGSIKILDFGIAKALAQGSEASDSPTMASPGVTGAGIILGTAAYMSPEQARGKVSTSAPTSGRSAVCSTRC
jgi:serine/threonine protein kinase